MVIDTIGGDNVWAVVPAAGIGSRMASDTPKQYLPLLGKAVIEHTLERLLSVPCIEGIVVALHPRDQQFKQLSIASQANILTAVGGSERSDSVLSALSSLQKKAKLSDWVLVHDAARCCICVNAVTRLLDNLSASHIGGILAVPSSDTLKQIDKDQNIRLTLDRRVIWQAQTPQLFRYGLLREALQVALQKGQQVTDESSAVEFSGYQPKVVMGDYDNIKITHPEDLAVAATILRKQQEVANR